MIANNDYGLLQVGDETMKKIGEMWINRHLDAKHTVKVIGFYADAKSGVYKFEFEDGTGKAVKK